MFLIIFKFLVYIFLDTVLLMIIVTYQIFELVIIESLFWSFGVILS